MNWNIVVSRESYPGQVLIGTEAGGTSWIWCSELPLTCPSIWPTRSWSFTLSITFSSSLTFQIFPWLSSRPPGSDIWRDGCPAALLCYHTEHHRVSKSHQWDWKEVRCLFQSHRLVLPWEHPSLGPEESPAPDSRAGPGGGLDGKFKRKIKIFLSEDYLSIWDCRNKT